ncbi:MAG: hypothetical protein HIU84_14555 [Acidobacteria bacterium]|nr:hypothetical protein [Acidobacteriota bacterium]
MTDATSTGRSAARTRTREGLRGNVTVYGTPPRERIPAKTGERVADASLLATANVANRRRRECRTSGGGSSENSCQDDTSWGAADASSPREPMDVRDDDSSVG